jgi:serine/threonine protein kinase
MVGGYTPFDSGTGNPMTIYENILSSNMKLPRNMNSVTADLVSKFLDIDEDLRLSISDAKHHVFFIDEKNFEPYWKDVSAQARSPPHVPSPNALPKKVLIEEKTEPLKVRK